MNGPRDRPPRKGGPPGRNKAGRDKPAREGSAQGGQRKPRGPGGAARDDNAQRGRPSPPRRDGGRDQRRGQGGFRSKGPPRDAPKSNAGPRRPSAQGALQAPKPRQLPFPLDALRAAARVELLILDVDGVLTDGQLYYVGEGVEAKAFFAQDGAAIKMLQSAGTPVALITGRASEAVTRRAAELGIAHVYQDAGDKGAALNHLCAAADIAPARMAHAGDDVADLSLFDRVGLRLSVPGAHPEVAARAHYITKAKAGAGAVREICHLLLLAKGRWESALEALRTATPAS